MGGPPNPAQAGGLDRKLCQVVGINQNFLSSSGTLYHIQIEDRGPVLDRVSEVEVRRVNVIVYANYGEPNARIIHGRDHDFQDLRSQEHNRFVSQRIQELSSEARRVIEEKEQRQIFKIKAAIREYYLTKSDDAKREFEEANAVYPFLFSRAWMELKDERTRTVAASPEAVPAAPALVPPDAEAEEPVDVVYPLDAELRDRVIEIERLIIDLGHDLLILRRKGIADDILLQTCRKLVTRAKETLTEGAATEFNLRRLEMTRNSLMTTWKQIKSRLK